VKLLIVLFESLGSILQNDDFETLSNDDLIKKISTSSGTSNESFVCQIQLFVTFWMINVGIIAQNLFPDSFWLEFYNYLTIKIKIIIIIYSQKNAF